MSVSRLRHLVKVGPRPAIAHLVPEDQDVTFAPMEALADGLGGLDASRTRPISEVASGSYNFFAEGDLLLAKVTPCFENGKKALAKDLVNGVGFATSEVHVIRPDSRRINQRYLLYVLSAEDFRAAGMASMTGSGGLRRVSDQAILNYRPAITDLETQKAIADFLDRETARIDLLIEKKQQFAELLQERRSTLSTEAVTKGLNTSVRMRESGVDWIGAIPEHWETKPLRAFFAFRNEKNDPVKTENILSLSIARGVTPYSEQGRGGNKRKDDLTAYKLAYEGDIVLNSMNVIVGAVGLSKYFGAISPVYYALYAVSEATHVPYFEKVFLNAGFQRGLLRYGKGILIKLSGTGKLNTIRMKISTDDLKNLHFPSPPMHEQKAIAEFIEHQSTPLSTIAAKTEDSVERLREFRAAVITAAVTGQIDLSKWGRRGGVQPQLDALESQPKRKEPRA